MRSGSSRSMERQRTGGRGVIKNQAWGCLMTGTTLHTSRDSRNARVLMSRSWVCSRCVRGDQFGGPVFVRCAEIRELGEQVGVRSGFVGRDLSVGEDRKEDIHDIVGEASAVIGKRGRALGI